MRNFIPAFTLSGLLLASTGFGAEPEKYDLVIYGGSSAAVAAAVQAKKMGRSVVVIEPSDRIGGLTTGGLGQTDIGNKHVIGGISRDFYRAVRTWYLKPEAWKWEQKPEGGAFRGTGQSQTAAEEDTLWTFEPSTALAIYHDWVKQHDIKIIYGERLNRKGETKSKDNGSGYWTAAPGTVAEGVVKDGNRITEIVMESGKRFAGKFFMDATYEGDLMASGGVAYTVGREGFDVYQETLNGVQTKRAKHHQLADGVDPYVKPGDPSSGLLPWVDTTGPQAEGASDHRMQAFCFRMCLTDVKENQIPFHKPEGYDEQWYELLFRHFEKGGGEGRFPWINSLMPNRKTDTNNRDGFSTDFIGQNYEWPEGSFDKRKEIRAKHLLYQQGVMWSLANHPRVPERVRAEVSKWGMTKDEFTDGAGWQGQIYVREGRRMISDLVMLQQHCQQERPVEDSVGMGAYTMDSHHVRRHIDENGQVKNEGDVQVGGFPPYPISYRSIIPREQECANLVVPIALSSSHMAFGSIRMEPVFMILGQSGATAVSHAIDAGTTLQKVDYAKLRERLLADGQVLNYTAPPKDRTKLKDIKSFKGTIVDDMAAKMTGDWAPSVLLAGVGEGTHHDHAAGNGKASAKFTAKLPKAGTYDVQVAYVANGNRADNVPVTIAAKDGEKQATLNQKKAPAIDGSFTSVGRFEFDGEGSVTITNKDTNGHVVIDAVRWMPVE
ncbi:MAG: FAD-dependent oxidoreductase [Akkermansiaceae bacterium]|nr:FAD-dependent oxidoreductase [Akkermansiaceae bacterium]